MLLRAEHPEDEAVVADLHARAFGGPHVPRLVEALRRAPGPLGLVSVVAEVEGAVAGHVMLSASRLDAPRRLVDVLVLSPLAVAPEAQRRGIGAALVARAVEEAERTGAPLVFLEGDPGYYGPRGFERASPLGFRSPSLRIPDAAFQVRRLGGWAPWMIGTLVYAEAFWETDSVGLRDK